MLKMSDLRTGDRVVHETCGAGVVVSITADGAKVLYDNTGRNGRPVHGLYDARWFELHTSLILADPPSNENDELRALLQAALADHERQHRDGPFANPDHWSNRARAFLQGHVSKHSHDAENT